MAQRDRNTLDAIGAWSTNRDPVSGDERPERFRVAAVTPSLLTLLEAVPLTGRLLTPGDEEPGRAPVLVISHALWQQRFGGRSDILGSDDPVERDDVHHRRRDAARFRVPRSRRRGRGRRSMCRQS